MARADAAAEGEDGPPLGRRRLYVLLLAALTTIPLLAVRDLWHSDEPRYALVAREMLRDGHWIVLHVNQETYTEKPPLYFWCEALLGALFGGVREFAARFPSALSGAVGVLLCFELGRRLFCARVGLAGALMLATTQQWCWISQRVALDVMFSAFLLGAILLEEAGRAALERGRAPRAAWIRVAAFAAAGGAFLVKGPPALLFFAAALVARAWAGGELRSLGRVPWLRGVLALLAVVALWGVPWAARLGLDRISEILFRQTAGRMSESFAHAQKWHYYLRALPGALMPWTLAWAGIAGLAWKRRRARVGQAATLGRPAAAGDARVGRRFATAFSAICLVTFSCFSGKRALYLLPVVPLLALLTAHALDRLAPRDVDLLRHARRAAVAMALLATAAGLVWMPPSDRGFRIGPLEIPGQSPRPLGERVRSEADAGNTVALVDLHRAEGVIYYSGLPHLDTFDLPFLGPLPPHHPDVIRLRALAERLGERLVLVLLDTESARFLSVLPQGADKLDELEIDRRVYQFWRARGAARSP